MDVSWIEEESGFDALCSEWNGLHARLNRPSVFLRHEWARSAWAWRRLDSVLRIARISDAGGLVGFAPLVIRHERRRGLTCRVVEFLAVPDNQLSGTLAIPGREREAVAAVAHALRRRSDDWDLLRLDRLSAEVSASWRDALVVAGLSVGSGGAADASNPGILLGGGWEAYYGRRSRRLKKGNNLIKNRLQRSYGEVEVEWLHGPGIPADRWSAAIEDVIRVSAASWKADTGLTLDRPGPGAFIRALSVHAIREGWLSIWLLRFDGKVVATEYQIIHSGDIHALRADFDRSCDDDSPGTFLNWRLLERLFTEGGYRSYQMGPGENPYKLRWAEEFEPLFGVEACSRSWRGRAFAAMNRYVRPLLRRLRRESLNQVADSTDPARGK